MTEELLRYSDISDSARKTLYNRFHVVKHKARGGNIPFVWNTFDAFLEDFVLKYNELEEFKEQPFDPSKFRISFDRQELEPVGLGFCHETMVVVPYGRVDGRPVSRKAPVRKRQPKNKEKPQSLLRRPKLGDQPLYTAEETVRLSRVSAQLAVLLQELDGDVEFLVSLAHEAADATNF